MFLVAYEENSKILTTYISEVDGETHDETIERMLNNNNLPFSTEQNYMEIVQPPAAPERYWNVDFETKIITVKPEFLVEEKIKKITKAWEYCQSMINTTTVIFNNGADHQIGVDEFTQNVIDKRIGGIAIGITPNPSSFFPKGETFPISISHNELIQIAGLIAQKIEELMGIYFTHKATISYLTTIEDVEQYDVTTNYN